MKTLKEIIARLAEIDKEVRSAETVEAVVALKTEKDELITRKAELEDLEARKQTALDIQGGKVEGKPFEKRIMIAKTVEPEKLTQNDLLETNEYRSGYYKTLMGLGLSDMEKRSVAATNVAGAVPTQTNDEIMKKMRVLAPLLDEITLLRVNGNVNFAVEGTNNAAAIHTENAELTAQADTISTVSLGGYEINKLVRISKTVQTMTINNYESFLTDILSENIASIIEYYILYGSGSSQPEGVQYANTWSDGTNGVDWAAASPTYAELVELIGYLGGGYARRAKFCMSHQTFWQYIANIKDDSKYPIAITSTADNASRIMGFPVIFSDQMTAGEIFFGDFKKVVGNLAQDITVQSSDHSGFIYNARDYLGSAIFDCAIADGSGFVKSEATLA